MTERVTLPEYVATPVEDIDGIVQRISSRFASGVTLSLDYRRYNLKQLGYLLKDNEGLILEAARRDLGRGDVDAIFSDIVPVYNEIDLAVKRVKSWMKDETRYRDAMLSYKLMRPRVKKQPKGVALIIGPWNFPWQLNMNPLVAAIAAGCTAIVKPSEQCPYTSALMAELLPRYLDPEAYAIVLGDVPQVSSLLERQWGHILFTGSGRVGKIVAAAAAKTLSPTTLELGGKSPVIVSSCANVKIVALRLFSIKQLGLGQMCVTPDYILCVKSRVDDLVEACKQILSKSYPNAPHPHSIMGSRSSCALVNDAAFDRQAAMVEKAAKEGKLVVRGEQDRSRRTMGFSIVVLNENAHGETGPIVDEEIFGPVLPIIPVEDIESAIRFVNARPKPLALHVCSARRRVFSEVIERTTSGSATWNDFGFATISRTQPFGGVGESGWGSYHGYDGFRTFTHFKTILEVPYILEPVMSMRYPPMPEWTIKLTRFLLDAGTPYRRPSSVESERRRRIRAELFGWSLLAVAVVVGVYTANKVARSHHWL